MANVKIQNRSTRKRPKCAKELVQALTDGTLDGRTRHAAAILEARGIIAQEPDAAARALLVDALATWGVAQSAIMAEVTRSRGLVVDGALLPIMGELARTQGHILKITAALQALDDRAVKASVKPQATVSTDGTMLDVSAILLHGEAEHE